MAWKTLHFAPSYNDKRQVRRGTWHMDPREVCVFKDTAVVDAFQSEWTLIIIVVVEVRLGA